MEHARALINIVDAEGRTVATKPRNEVDKNRDIYNGVFTFVITPEVEIVLARIPEREDLPNRYAGSLGVSAATMRRHDESAQEASIRSLEAELHILGAQPECISEFFVPDIGPGVYMSLFYTIRNRPEAFSQKDIAELVTVPRQQLDDQLASTPEMFAPTLAIAWAHINDFAEKTQRG